MSLKLGSSDATDFWVVQGLPYPTSPTPLPPSQPTTESVQMSYGASDATDFWVVLTGANPGVYQGW